MSTETEEEEHKCQEALLRKFRNQRSILQSKHRDVESKLRVVNKQIEELEIATKTLRNLGQVPKRYYCWRVGGPSFMNKEWRCIECGGKEEHHPVLDQKQCGLFVEDKVGNFACELTIGHLGPHGRAEGKEQ